MQTLGGHGGGAGLAHLGFMEWHGHNPDRRGAGPALNAGGPGDKARRHKKMAKRLMWALWPSFLVAAGAPGLFFSVFDPLELHWFGQIGLLSRQASYTLGFFF